MRALQRTGAASERRNGRMRRFARDPERWAAVPACGCVRRAASTSCAGKRRRAPQPATIRFGLSFPCLNPGNPASAQTSRGGLLGVTSLSCAHGAHANGLSANAVKDSDAESIRGTAAIAASETWSNLNPLQPRSTRPSQKRASACESAEKHDVRRRTPIVKKRHR